MISLSRLDELVGTVSNAQLIVNDSMNLVVLIVLRLRFTEIICSRFADCYLLSLTKLLFQSICLTWSNDFIDNFLSQLNSTI